MEAGNMDSLEFYPFAYSLYSENIAHYCWYCLDEERTHRKCSGCKTAVFCDKDCQKLAWKDHKYECRGIKATSNVPNIEVRLLGRIVVRYKAILCGKDKEDANFYTNRTSRRSIMDIWAHTKNIAQDQYAMKKFNAIYDELTAFYDSKALLSRDIVFQLHCRDFINRHAISDRAYIKEIGKGLYLDLCAYDHSCRPNTIYVCDGTKAILRPLNSGVNLLDRSTTFYSYIDLLCGKQERRKLLKDTWYFHCECDRCTDNSEHILVSMNCPHCKTDPPQRLCLFGEHPYKDPETQLIVCPTCRRQLSREEVMEALGAMRFIDDLLERSNFDQMGREESNRFLEDLLERFGRLLPRINIYYCKIVQALIPFIDPENNCRLLDLHLQVEECIRVCYPHNHPALGFHLRNIGIFSTKLEDYDKAVAYLTEALHIFSFVMRDEHSLTKTTRSFLDEAVRQRVDKLAAIETKGMPKADGERSLTRRVNAEPTRVPSAIENGSCRKTKCHNDAIEKRSSGPRSPKKLEIPVIDGAQEDLSIVVPNPHHPHASTSVSTASPHHHVHKHHFHHNHYDRNKNAKADEVVGAHSTSLLLVGGQAENPNEPPFVDTAGGVKKKAAHKKVSPRSRTPIPPALLASATAVGGTVDDDALLSSSSALTVPTLTVPTADITFNKAEADPPAFSFSTSAHAGNASTVSACDDGSTVLASEPSSPSRHFDIVSTTTLVRKSRQICVESLSMNQLPQGEECDGGDERKAASAVK